MMRRLFALLLCLAFLALSATTRGRGEGNLAKSHYNSESSEFVLRDEGERASSSLPKGKGAWTVEISRSGGMRPVKETVKLNSAGEINVVSEQMRGGKTSVTCSRTEKLSARELLKINAAITSAKPSAWKDNYSDPAHPVCCDQPTTEVKLQQRGGKGQEQSYSTSWYPGSYNLVPTDLKAIATFIQPQWDTVRDHCDK